MRRTGLACALAFLGTGSLLAHAQAAPDFGQPLAGLGSAELQRFADGVEEFAAEEDADDGLGPVFNDVSCANCHSAAAVGGGSTRIETRFGTTTAGVFDPMASKGGSLRQDHALGPTGSCNYVPEIVPPEATIVAGRRTTPLFGLGLVDAVPDATLRALASTERSKTPSTAGVVSVLPQPGGGTLIGKFGWKAQVPNLLTFAGDAYLNEMGITSPQFPAENCPQGNCALLSCNPRPDENDDGTGVDRFADFMTLLAPPPRGPINNDAKNGEKEFEKVGCADCHVNTLQTGPSPIAALSNVTFHPYSDFLLHDMGALGDGIQQNGATGKLMRTAPLWGLREVDVFLHDGRAHTLRDAIAAHAGQGAAARDAFMRLPARQQDKILTFLGSL